AVLSNSQGVLTVVNGSIAFSAADLAAGVLDGLAITAAAADEPGFTLHFTATTTEGASSASTSHDLVVTIASTAPTGATLSSDTVAENSADGTVIGTVTGIDPEAGDVLSYSLIDDAGGRFAIDAASGELTVADGALLDYESATSHAITVRV